MTRRAALTSFFCKCVRMVSSSWMCISALPSLAKARPSRTARRRRHSSRAAIPASSRRVRARSNPQGSTTIASGSASASASSGVDHYRVMEWMGHRSVTTLQTYGHLSPADPRIDLVYPAESGGAP